MQEVGTVCCRGTLSPRRVARALPLLAAVVLTALCSLSLPLFAAAEASGAEDVSVSVIQQAAPNNTTRSITFLSSGYINEATFLSDVTTCRNALINNSAGIIADPWPRYMPFVNVYAVYERSPEEGVSRPRGPLHNCSWMKTCVGPDVTNNLGCSFGTPNPHLMSCDINKVVSLAAVAPAQDVVVVLINASDPGGVATDGIAYITNDEAFMAYMLVHYLNRAMANLHEEYSLGFDVPFAEAARYVSPNCAISKDNALAKWAHWFTEDTAAAAAAAAAAASIPVGGLSGPPAQWFLERSSPPLFFAEAPLSSLSWVLDLSSHDASLLPSLLDAESLGSGCTFGNFTAPTEESCMMRNSSVNYMCPVCREQLSRSFYFPGVNHSVLPSPSRATLNLVSQRCPPEGFTVYVGSDGGESSSVSASSSASSSAADAPPLLYLSLGRALQQNDMAIVWVLDDAAATVLATNTSILSLSADAMGSWSFPATITATITDNSPYVPAEVRTAAFSSSTVFRVERWADDSPLCDPSSAPECVRDLQMDAPDVVFCVAPTAAAGAETQAREVRASYPSLNVLGESPGEMYSTQNIIIVATITGGVAVVFVVTILVVHCCAVRRLPREVLNAQLLDRLIYFVLLCCSVVDLVVAVLVLVFAALFIPKDLFVGLELMIGAVVLGGVVYLVAVFNVCGTLFRWYGVCLACSVLLFLLSLGVFALGILALWAHFNQHSPGVSDQLVQLWTKTLMKSESGNQYICSVQYFLECSGYHAGCFMTNSPECPVNCGSNLYVNACQVPFLSFIGRKYLPVGILLIIGGFFFAVTATLDTLYFMRYRQLSRTGRMRRMYRKDPHPPVVPITHHECSKARSFFEQVCTRPGRTLEGKAAVSFLESTFGEKMHKAEREKVRTMGPLTFDDLMSVYFPYVVASATDPRMLTSDDVDDANNMIDLQRKQYAKLRSYSGAAGCLSPEKLRQIYQDYAAKRFMPQTDELLAAMREEAAQCPEAPFCRGLSPMELEGLRAAWVALHPRVVGPLSQEEVRLFYEWSHGVALAEDDDAAFADWCEMLDVRGTGEVGWAEFCYPYAQRALLLEARKYLCTEEKEVPPETLTRKSAVDMYGASVVEQCFLPYESDIPIERLLAFVLQQKTNGTGRTRGTATTGTLAAVPSPTLCGGRN